METTKGHSAAPGAQKIIDWSVENKLETCFDRAQKMKPCPIGKVGACCKNCNMGPCRLTGKNAEEEMHRRLRRDASARSRPATS